MKKMRRAIRVVASVLLLMGFVFVTGCEDAVTGNVLTITPDNVELEGTQSVLLTAEMPEGTNALASAYLPLKWSVNNPELGRVVSRGGSQAVYASTGRTGQNIIFVVDQGGREGLTAISQK